MSRKTVAIISFILSCITITSALTLSEIDLRYLNHYTHGLYSLFVYYLFPLISFVSSFVILFPFSKKQMLSRKNFTLLALPGFMYGVYVFLIILYFVFSIKY